MNKLAATFLEDDFSGLGQSLELYAPTNTVLPLLVMGRVTERGIAAFPVAHYNFCQWLTQQTSSNLKPSSLETEGRAMKLDHR
jgi:hypothetical protein